MPQDIGSAQWNTWFQRQPPAIRNQVYSALGLMQTNDSVPQSSSVGGYAPELSPQDYGLASQGAAPVDLDKKGNVVPFDLNTATTTTNVLQDRNQYTIDNATAMQAGPGAYSSTAFNPVSALQPSGNPLQSPGYQAISRYANAGGSGWESFIADQMLNQGLDPSAAAAKLQQFVTAPETATTTPEEKAQRAALIASLPGRSIKDANDPLGQSYTMSVPDFSDPGKARNTVDWAKIADTGDKMFQQLASDPQAGYIDKSTGLPYAAPPEQTESAAAKWYSDRGLSLPTDTYNDPQYSMAGYDPQAVDAWQQSQQQAGTAADQALKDFQGSQSTYDDMQKAWDQAMANPQQPGSFGHISSKVDPNLDIKQALLPQQAQGGGWADYGGRSGPGQPAGPMDPFGHPLDGNASVLLGTKYQNATDSPPNRATGWDAAGGQNPSTKGMLAALFGTKYQNAPGAPTPDQPTGWGAFGGQDPTANGNASVLLGTKYQNAPGGSTPNTTPSPAAGWGAFTGGGGGSDPRAGGGFLQTLFGGQTPTGPVRATGSSQNGPSVTLPMIHMLMNGDMALGKKPNGIQALLGGDMSAFIPNGQRRMTQADLDAAKKKADTARTANTQAIAARSKTQDAPSSVTDAIRAYAQAQNLAASGRTPLGDQLAQRALAARAAGLYGY